MTNTEKHIELYKKYRPSKWIELIGQQKVAKSLQSAVKAEKLPTAYLFAGPRGCGKTSAALLLAKSLNCLNPTPTLDPCNKCEVCEAVDAGRQLGVNYISAANKGTVDDIRGIVQQARLHQPVKRQVWIIDEVHSISRQAFDALLIPLEEKNMPALFIFCTTEIDRIPQTILSRIQQRRFTLVDADEMISFATKVTKKENLTISEDAIKDAVRQGRGSVRDTLSALEAISETGSFSLSVGGQLLEAISSKNLTEILSVISQANSDGQDCRDLAEQLFEDLRDLLLSASGVDPSLVGVIPVSDEAKVTRGLLGKRGIMLSMDEIGDAITQMTMGADARIHLEIGLVKTLNQLKRLQKAIDARA